MYHFWLRKTFESYSREVLAVYCEAEDSYKSVSLSVWIQRNFDGVSWLMIFILFPLAIYILITTEKKRITFLRKMQSLFFSLVALFVGGDTNIYRRSILSSLIILTGFIVSTYYETYFTSQVIVPPERKIFYNFKELIDNGYKHLQQKDNVLVEYVAEIFRQNGLSRKQNTSVYVFNWEKEYSARELIEQRVTHSENAYRLIGNVTLKLVIGINKEFIASSLKTVTDMHPNVKCHAATQVAASYKYFWEFIWGYREEYHEFFSTLSEKGFFNFWNALHQHITPERHLASIALYEESKALRISLNMKIHTIFIIYGYFNLLAFSVFLLELLCGIINFYFRMLNVYYFYFSPSVFNF